MKPYNPSEVEKKWQNVWEETKIYSPNLDSAKKPFYNLMMFPYPSAEGMHVGNMYAFTGADIYGRFQRMQGYDVFEPIGLDGFGIHSENYAIKVGKHPAEQAKISEENFYRQLRSIGNSYEWTRTIETYKPEYYKWTQWLFIQLFKAGLAYKKKAPVNFCPKDLTVLADEQVIDGKCERCGSVVEKRELEQWFFKITDYAEKLLSNIPELDWSEKVKVAQKNWIGKSEGARIRFVILSEAKDLPASQQGGDSSAMLQNDNSIEVFTTRPDTLFGATFLVISPELAKKWLDVGWKAPTGVGKYIEEALVKRTLIEENTDKTGVFSGIYAINPVNQEKIPIWVANYVLAGYGTGAIMAVPAHDPRDFEFAKKFDLQVKTVILSETKDLPASQQGGDSSAMSQNDKMIEVYVGEGEIINSGDWNGWKTPESISKVIKWLEKKAIGKREVNYHLRDWLISRQRYWGPPIPMIDCPKCGWQPVAEADLPVVLPELEDFKPEGNGKSPLANIDTFINTKCPNCDGPAKRETDVSDTFLDSAWYFFRYACTDIESSAFDRERLKKWLPVNMYIGGAEHSVLHLLYSRFIAMVLADLKFTDFEEPFKRFYAHGLIVKDGAKMSKSRGNVIIPDKYIAKFGADTLRCYLMFLGPFSAGGDFRDTGIEGMNRFLKRVWKLCSAVLSSKYQVSSTENTKELDTAMNKTIKKVTEDIENLRYNTALATLMEYYNVLSEFYTKYKILDTKYCKTFVLLLAPFAPHMTEELYQQLTIDNLQFTNKGKKDSQSFNSIHLESWPSFDEKSLEESEVNIAVSVNGKTRDVIKIEKSKVESQKFVEQLAKESENVKKHLQGKKILKTVYVQGKIINFVID